MKRLLRLLLADGDRLVDVVSWRPGWGEYGLEWPTMRVDSPGGSRATVSPVWDWHWLREIAARVFLPLRGRGA